MNCMFSTVSVTTTEFLQLLFKDSPATSITLHNFHRMTKRQVDLSLLFVWPNFSTIQKVARGVTRFA